MNSKQVVASILLNNAVRAAILNASDAVNEQNPALGYAIREAVSGQMVYLHGEYMVECDADSVIAMLRTAAQGASERVSAAIESVTRKILSLTQDLRIQIVDRVDGANVLLGNIDVCRKRGVTVTATIADERGTTTEAVKASEEDEAIERARAFIAAA